MSIILLNPINSIENDDIDINRKIKLLSGNTGNLLFSNALKEQIQFSEEMFLNSEDEYSENNIYVMPSSNFINPKAKWLGKVGRIIEQKRMNVILVGVGAQAEFDERPIDIVNKLTKEQKRFFEVIAEQSKSIGVRGEFSAECLNHMGIKNIRIIGCPSVYKYVNKFPKLEQPNNERTIVNITPKTDAARILLELGIRENSVWIKQEMSEILNYHSIIDLVLAKKIYFTKCNICVKSINEYSKLSSRIFFDLKKWEQYIKGEKFRFSYGTRFHGNMVSLRAGVPALWIVHDQRTLELVKTLELPHWKDKFDNRINIEKLIAQCDYTNFYKKYTIMYKQYISFLQENNINNKQVGIRNE